MTELHLHMDMPRTKKRIRDYANQAMQMARPYINDLNTAYERAFPETTGYHPLRKLRHAMLPENRDKALDTVVERLHRYMNPTQNVNALPAATTGYVMPETPSVQPIQPEDKGTLLLASFGGKHRYYTSDLKRHFGGIRDAINARRQRVALKDSTMYGFRRRA